MSKVPAYIGITDFTSVEEVERMRAVLDKVGSTHALAVGVMMSYKTLNGLETKWTDVWPKKESVKDIFVRREGVLNVLHYADYDGLTTFDDLSRSLDYAGPGVDAIQFDMPWPAPALLQQLKEKNPDLRFIVQVSGKAIEMVGGDKCEVARRLNVYYQDCGLDYALFDLSGGRGKPINISLLSPYIWRVREMMHDLSIVVAGGLGPDSVMLVEPLVKDLPGLSIDAQGKLRESGDSHDPVDWDRAERYLEKAAALFALYRR